MNLLEMLLSSKNGAIVGEIAKKSGLDENTTKNVITEVLPSLSRGLENKTKNDQSLDELLSAIEKGDHQRYIENPESLSEDKTVDDGNSILGHIFGNKDVSRNVAGHAAEKTGVSSGIIKKMLPMLAAAAMGALGSKSAAGGLLGAALGTSAGRSTAYKVLSSFLDSNKDGSIVDDLLRMAKRFF